MLLKVQCDKCQTRYKLDESRIQGRGAKITCPRCGHVFVVMKEGAAGARADASAKKGAPASPSAGSPSSGPPSRERVAPPTPRPKTPPRKAGRVPMDNRGPDAGARTGPSTIPRPRDADSLNWKEVGITTFKVKVAIGLVYDFSDVATLRKYIDEKRVVPTDRVSFDGKVWYTLKDIPDLDAFFIDKWMELKKARAAGSRASGSEAAGLSPGMSDRGSGPKTAARSAVPPSAAPRSRSGGTSPSSSSTALDDDRGDSRPGRRSASPAAASKPPSSLSAAGRSASPAAASKPPSSLSTAGRSASPAAASKPPSSPTEKEAGLLGSELFDNIAGFEGDDLAPLPKSEPKKRRRARPSSPDLGLPASIEHGAEKAGTIVDPLFGTFEIATLAILALLIAYLAFELWTTKESDWMIASELKRVTHEMDVTMQKYLPVAYAAAYGRSTGEAEAAAPTASSTEPTREEQPGKPPGADGSGTTLEDAGTLEEKPPRAKKPSSPIHRAPARSSRTKGDKQRKAPRRVRHVRKPRGTEASVSVSSISASDLMVIGRQSVKQGDFPNAIQSFKAAVEMKPDNGRYHYELGYALYMAGRYREAEATLKRALELDGSQREAHKYLGEIYSRRGQREQAVSEFQHYLAGSPRDAAAIRERMKKLTGE